MNVYAEERIQGMNRILSKVECRNLEKLSILEGYNVIGSRAFRVVEEVEGVEIPTTVYALRSHAFEMTCFKEITIPSTVKEIGDFCFAHSKVEKLTFDCDVIGKDLGEKLCYFTSNLKTIIFNGKVDGLPKDMLSYCGNLEKVVFNGEVDGVIDFKLYNTAVSKLKTIEFKGGIGDNTELYLDHTSIETIDFPLNCNLKNLSCVGCQNLKRIIIPSQVTKLPKQAFLGCTSLEEIYIPQI